MKTFPKKKHLELWNKVRFCLVFLLVGSSLVTGCSKRDREQPVGPASDAVCLSQLTANDCVLPLNNRLYAPKVLKLIEQASDSIDIILYQNRFYAAYPDSFSNRLLLGLARASSRGISIRFLIESSDWNPENSIQNKRVAELLFSAGIDVRFDAPTRNSHNKLLIIDSDVVVIGSANWSFYSLERNNETSLAIRSPVIVQYYRGYFDVIFKEAHTSYPLTYPVLGPAQITRTSAAVSSIKGNVTHIEQLPFSQDSFEIKLDHSVTILLPAMLCEEMFSVFPGFPDSLLSRHVTVTAKLPKGKRAGTVEALTLDLLESRVRQEFQTRLTATTENPFPPEDRFWKSCYHPVSFRPLDNDLYVPGVIEHINTARTKIRIIQIDCNYYEKWRSSGPEPATNQLLERLLAAMKRGVHIEFLTDYRASRPFSRRKKAFIEKLSRKGATVYLDDAETTTHSKLLIIDDRYLVIGSSNWSQTALTDNNESSILLESEKLAEVYNRFFDRCIQSRFEIASGPPNTAR